MSFPLPEPVSFDLGSGVETVTSLAEASAALARLPAAIGEKPAFREATALIARAIRISDDNAIAAATRALKAAFAAEGLARHY
ncbi:MAG TPA: hypothetical protein VHA35_07865 [Dongiaceae bacterium]|jgi:hypothetical protein|nr:hypothetical protein [Dongiaceae bacterium]